MDFQDVVRRRRMIRTFTDQSLEPAIVERVIANALRAPSAGFTQGWGFLVLQEPADRALFWQTATRAAGEAIRPAPLIVVALSNKDAYLDRYAEPDKGVTDRDESRWPVPYWDVDTGMAALLMLLTAVDAGLGACYVGVQSDMIDSFRQAFGIPFDHRPVGAVAIGHRSPDTPRQPHSWKARRRSTGEVVHHGRW